MNEMGAPTVVMVGEAAAVPREGKAGVAQGRDRVRVRQWRSSSRAPAATNGESALTRDATLSGRERELMVDRRDGYCIERLTKSCI